MSKSMLKDKKEPNIEVVGLPKELIAIMKDNKSKTGISVRFYTEQAVRKQLIADGLLKEEIINPG